MRYDPDMSDDNTAEPQLPIIREKSREKKRMKEPSKYKVVLLNDDFTPMDWVVHLLVQFFSKSEDQAGAIMLEVHKNGKGIAGLYTKDIAETKVTIANQAAQQDGYPFRSEIEEDV
jgi:ATP-dependent Clp protease adaptor protein ClpS